MGRGLVVLGMNEVDGRRAFCYYKKFEGMIVDKYYGFASCGVPLHAHLINDPGSIFSALGPLQSRYRYMLKFSQGRGHPSSLAEQYTSQDVLYKTSNKHRCLLENSAVFPNLVWVLIYPHILPGTQCYQDADTLQGYIQ